MKNLIQQFPDDTEQTRKKYKLLHPKYDDQDVYKPRQFKVITISVGCVVFLYLIFVYAKDYF